MQDVFISYSRIDVTPATALVELLRSFGLDVWIDTHGIDGATNWSGEIVDAIADARVFVLLLSKHSIDSHNVLKEVMLASERTRPILPIELEQVTLSRDFEYPLAGVQRVRFTDHEAIRRSLKRLGLAKQGENDNTPEHPDKVLKSRKSVAVLPFEDLSPQKDYDWFTLGLTDELISVLGQIEQLRVISRQTVMDAVKKHHTSKALGKELGVDYLVEGSVRRFADQLKITARLIDAFHDEQLWTEAFRGKTEDVFEFQESVAIKIVQALKVTLSPVEQQTVHRRITENLEAYDLHLQAMNAYTYLSEEGVRRTIELLERAIAVDPRFAAAHASLGRAFGELYEWYDHRPEILAHAKQAALDALHFDPDLLDTQTTLSYVYRLQGMHKEAKRAANRLIEIAPNLSRGFAHLADVLAAEGDSLGSARAYEESVKRMPENVGLRWSLMMHINDSRDPEWLQQVACESLPYFKARVEAAPDDEVALIRYASVLDHAGETDAALNQLERIMQTDVKDRFSFYNAACVYARHGERQRAVDCMRECVRLGFHDLQMATGDPDLVLIKDDPELVGLFG